MGGRYKKRDEGRKGKRQARKKPPVRARGGGGIRLFRHQIFCQSRSHSNYKVHHSQPRQTDERMKICMNPPSLFENTRWWRMKLKLVSLVLLLLRRFREHLDVRRFTLLRYSGIFGAALGLMVISMSLEKDHNGGLLVYPYPCNCPQEVCPLSMYRVAKRNTTRKREGN